MKTSATKHLPKSTVELEIQVPWSEIKTTYDKVFKKVISEIEVEGFRKGKAPKHLVEKKVDKNKVYQEVIKEVVPKVYGEAIAEQKLKPIAAPKIELVSAKEGEDWVIKATIALKPIIKLKNYKEAIKALKRGKTTIWTPGAPNKKKGTEKKASLDELIEALLKEVEVEVSDVLIEEEANRLLANLIDQTQKLGLTIEKYLFAKGKTTEQLKAEYTIQAARNLSLEFVLSEIADKENITVTAEDLDKLIAKVEKPEEKEKLKKDSYYLAHLIRQQKTLEFLDNL